MYDPRLGRWWSMDPVVKPWESRYAGMGNNPILYSDPKGLHESDYDPNYKWENENNDASSEMSNNWDPVAKPYPITSPLYIPEIAKPMNKSEFKSLMSSVGQNPDDVEDVFQQYALDKLDFIKFDPGVQFSTSQGNFNPEAWGDITLTVGDITTTYYGSFIVEVKTVEKTGRMIYSGFKQLPKIIEYLGKSDAAKNPLLGAELYLITTGDVKIHQSLVTKCNAENIRLYHAELYSIWNLPFFVIRQYAGPVVPVNNENTFHLQFFGIPRKGVVGDIPMPYPNTELLLP